MTTVPIPNSEKLVGKYLRDLPDTYWKLPSGSDVRVVGKPPDEGSRSTPWIMLTQLDATGDPNLTPDYLVTYFLQFDCYAGEEGGQPEAIRLGAKTRQALASLGGTLTDPGYEYAGGTVDGGTAVVTSVRFTSHSRIPDTEVFEPARERVVLDAEVLMHPLAGTLDGVLDL